jgi:hypothetical protein
MVPRLLEMWEAKIKPKEAKGKGKSKKPDLLSRRSIQRVKVTSSTHDSGQPLSGIRKKQDEIDSLTLPNGARIELKDSACMHGRHSLVSPV